MEHLPGKKLWYYPKGMPLPMAGNHWEPPAANANQATDSQG
jgi:hypothetical protein